MRKVIVSITEAAASDADKRAKQKEKYKKLLAKLDADYKNTCARVKTLEKQIKELDKEYSMKSKIVKPKPAKLSSPLDRKNYNGKGTPVKKESVKKQSIREKALKAKNIAAKQKVDKKK